MIHTRMMIQALNQADCHEYCVHAEALRNLNEVIHKAVEIYAANHDDSLMEIFQYGLHVGYKLAQLEKAEVPNYAQA